jgi:hypothetical protein
VNIILRVLLGAGRLPEPLRAQLAAEDVLVLEEGLFGSGTYVNNSGFDGRSVVGTFVTSGAIAMTNARLVVWASRRKRIDVTREQPQWRAIEVQAETPDRVRFTYEAKGIDPSTSGRVTLRLRTAQAARIADMHAARGSDCPT